MSSTEVTKKCLNNWMWLLKRQKVHPLWVCIYSIYVNMQNHVVVDSEGYWHI